MKDCIIRFRVSEEEKKAIEMLAEASPYTKGLSEYILDLISEDAKLFHPVEVDAVVRGANKAKTETVEKRRVSLGSILVDEYGRGTVKQYRRLIKEADELIGSTARKSNHYMFLEVGGKRVGNPAPMVDFVQFE